MWVENAQRDHADFVDQMTSRGVDVVELHDLLGQTMDLPEARTWLLDRKIIANRVGLGLVAGTRAFLDSLTGAELARVLIGGLTTSDLPADYLSGYVGLVRESLGRPEYLLPPLPNTLYTRDTTCWINGGLTLNPLYWPARHDETLLMQAIYRFHPDYTGSKIWWGDAELDWGQASLEGGDVMPVGNGTVLIGMSERTSRQAITQLAQALFQAESAERIVVAGMPKLRAAMHLDTVFTFADRDLATGSIRRSWTASTPLPSIPPTRLRAWKCATSVTAASWTSSPKLWATGSCGWWRPRGIITPPSASSGTVRTTPSRSNSGRRARTRPRALHDVPEHPRRNRLTTTLLTLCTELLLLKNICLPTSFAAQGGEVT